VVILGISAYGHDAAAAIMVDGDVVAACEEERFSRVKHDGSFPSRSIACCLEAAGVREDEVEHIGFYHNPWLHLERRLWHGLKYLPFSLSFLKDHGRDVSDWRAMFGVKRRFPRAAFEYVEHHIAHAASAFYPSPFSEAAILSVDGMGEWSTTVLAKGSESGIEKMSAVNFPHSLGIFYEAVTQYLGFRPHNDEYKVMGLSAYGSDRFHGLFRDLVKFNGNGNFNLDLTMFRHHLGNVPFYSSTFCSRFGPPRERGVALDSRHADIASAAQETLESSLLRMTHSLFGLTGLANLCIAGGVGLNCVANGRLLDDSPFQNIFVQPASYDSGCALGCCYHIYHQLLGNPRLRANFSPFLGEGFDNSSVEKAIQKTGFESRTTDNPDTECARMLADGRVVGWFQGRMEFGPRALGARSILANPTLAETKGRADRIKKRETFRPFAPSVLAENSREFFRMKVPSPHMLFTREVKEERRGEIPAVVHVDGSARVQTVSEAEAPLFHGMIAEFARLTGVPVVLNTSLNLKGEPIARTPEDALSVFARSDLDALFMGNHLVLRR
jgi:carbamoyltransferase